jgi:hypothetical protein
VYTYFWDALYIIVFVVNMSLASSCDSHRGIVDLRDFYVGCHNFLHRYSEYSISQS